MDEYFNVLKKYLFIHKYGKIQMTTINIYITIGEKNTYVFKFKFDIFK
jgi:hypothetical protein